MMAEQGFFKTVFFGFHKQNVLDYIARLNDEHDQLLSELEDELETVQQEAEENRRYAEEVQETRRRLEELQVICSQQETYLEELSRQLEQAGEREQQLAERAESLSRQLLDCRKEQMLREVVAESVAVPNTSAGEPIRTSKARPQKTQVKLVTRPRRRWRDCLEDWLLR